MIKNARKMIFSVGHSDHTIGRFIELLSTHRISAIADVRSMPYSRFHPQFNRDQLQAALLARGIRYVFLGDELGARRSEPQCYVKGKARYELIARTQKFQEGLNRLREGMDSHLIALMCAEKDPITCHRAILVTRHLRSFDTSICHIHSDGGTEAQAALEERLLKLTRVDVQDLFTGRCDAIERAYAIQGERIAYTARSTGHAAEEVKVEYQDIHNRIY